MIDVHCHILPGVDDGPVDIEEAEKMIDMMYEDGIRGAVATSHRNHPIDFKPTTDYDSSIRTLRETVRKKYPDFKIYSGAELYIRDGYLEVVDSKPYDFKIANTEYVLIEFSAEATYEEISDAVYEFKIRGMKPVLAHIDKYSAIWRDEALLGKLKAEGAYIQVTGATLIGKYGKTVKKAMRKLIKKGYVDFVASDGHSPERRKPLLKRAYRVVSRDYSGAEADRIFSENPIRLVEGREVRQRVLRKPIFDVFYKFKFATAIFFTLFILGIAFIWLLGSAK